MLLAIVLAKHLVGGHVDKVTYTRHIYGLAMIYLVAADAIKLVVGKWHFSDISLSEADILQSSCLLHGSPQHSFIHLQPCHLANILTESNSIVTSTTTCRRESKIVS